jgi:hypothetical protein
VRSFGSGDGAVIVIGVRVPALSPRPEVLPGSRRSAFLLRPRAGHYAKPEYRTSGSQRRSYEVRKAMLSRLAFLSIRGSRQPTAGNVLPPAIAGSAENQNECDGSRTGVAKLHVRLQSRAF